MIHLRACPNQSTCIMPYMTCEGCVMKDGTMFCYNTSCCLHYFFLRLLNVTKTPTLFNILNCSALQHTAVCSHAVKCIAEMLHFCTMHTIRQEWSEHGALEIIILSVQVVVEAIASWALWGGTCTVPKKKIKIIIGRFT